MDILLLMAPTTSSIGYAGRGDYAMMPDGALRERREHQVVPFVYAGAAIMSPSLFLDAPAGEFSLTRMFDRANEQERLFGLRLDGVWMHVGRPPMRSGMPKRRFWRAWPELPRVGWAKAHRAVPTTSQLKPGRHGGHATLPTLRRFLVHATAQLKTTKTTPCTVEWGRFVALAPTPPTRP